MSYYKTQDIDVDVDSYLARHGSQAASLLNKLANKTVAEEVIHVTPVNSKKDETVIIKTDQEDKTTKDFELAKSYFDQNDQEVNMKRDLEQFMREEEVERYGGIISKYRL